MSKLSRKSRRTTFLTCLLICFSVASFSQIKGIPDLNGPYLGQNPPGEVPQIFAKDIVSTDWYNHSSVSFSPDGDEIYWAMAPLDEPRRIYYSKLVNGKWSEPAVIQFTLSEDGDCPVISPDGKKMYFNSNRPADERNLRRERIWCAEKNEGDWGEPYPLGREINDGHLHWQVSVDDQGNVYFGSERQGSVGKDDVFIAEYVNGQYKTPVSLNNKINSVEHESTPFMDPRGRYIIFCRDGLRISFKEKNKEWSESVSMGESLNGSCPYVSPDGKYLFFLKMGMGYNDIYWVSAHLIEKLRPGSKK